MSQAQTATKSRVWTHTEVDIRRVAECFAADLFMLARRTNARTDEWAQRTSYDVTVAAINRCLSAVDVQLINGSGLVAAHKYTVLETADIYGDSDRPGGIGTYNSDNVIDLDVILSIRDDNGWQNLKNSGILKCNWGPSNRRDIEYGSRMKPTAPRRYSSNGYGWNRQSFKMAG